MTDEVTTSAAPEAGVSARDDNSMGAGGGIEVVSDTSTDAFNSVSLASVRQPASTRPGIEDSWMGPSRN